MTPTVQDSNGILKSLSIRFHKNGDFINYDCIGKNIGENEDINTSNLTKLLPLNYIEIIERLTKLNIEQLNEHASYKGKYWLWSFTRSQTEVHANAVEFTDFMLLQEYNQQYSNIKEGIDKQQLTLFLKRLVHDLKSPISSFVTLFDSVLKPFLVDNLPELEKELLDDVYQKNKFLAREIGNQVNINYFERRKEQYLKSYFNAQEELMYLAAYLEELPNINGNSVTVFIPEKQVNLYTDKEKIAVFIFSMAQLLQLHLSSADIAIKLTINEKDVLISFTISIKGIAEGSREDRVPKGHSVSFFKKLLASSEFHQINVLIQVLKGEFEYQEITSEDYTCRLKLSGLYNVAK